MRAMKRLLALAPVLLAAALAQSPKAATFDPLFWAKAKPGEVRAYFEDLAEKEGRPKAPAEARRRVLALLVNRTDRFGRTPLHYAAALNPDPQVVAVLIEMGAEVNARDLLKFIPLHYAAAFNENPAVSELLIEKGAEIEATDLEGKTPLHVAALNQKNPEVIAVLLKAGADAKKKDIFGKTPLDYALENEHLRNGPAIALLKAAMR